MAISLDQLFEIEKAQKRIGREELNQEIFKRAYYKESGPFGRVCNRLDKGFSVLVYLSGNCMTAAAQLVMAELSGIRWIELGMPEGNSRTATDIWQRSTIVFEEFSARREGAKFGPVGVVFHNLDLLTDGRGGLDPANEVKTALFYLIHSARTGILLGLSDKDAGELPVVIRRAFDEEIWLDEIPVGRFASLIPYTLGKRLVENDVVPDGPVWLIASRLRWTDPIRAVAIMETVAKRTGEGKIKQILRHIMQETQTVEFLNPENIEMVDLDSNGRPTGFEKATIDLLQTGIIDPFRLWVEFTGGADEVQYRLRKLPPGLILHGPAGTGKTRLARWIASSIASPVRLVSAADLKRADWGLTERLVKDLFRSARRAAPCVIILDDADDLLPDRADVQGNLASAERGIVNAFLQELEGWQGRLEGVLVILTTNRYEALDGAAKQRLHIHQRIPFPLDKTQIKEIVTAVAKSYHMNLAPTVLDSLTDHFVGPLKSTTEKIEDPETRRWLNSNLYSPREIAAAMRLLVIGNNMVPTLEDVERMKQYLTQKHAVQSLKAR